MRARVVAPAAGARWLLEGWRIFRAAPLGWVAVVAAYLLIVLVASAIPGIGIVAIALATPAFSVSFMSVARSAGTAGSASVGQLFDGFRTGTRSQLLLGAVYFACIAVAIGVTALATGAPPGVQGGTALERPGGPVEEAGNVAGESADKAAGETDGGRAAVQGGAPRSPLALAVFLGLYLPTMMGFWFAPVLAAWHSVGVAKSLFFSFMACLMNWRAFLVYGALLAALVFALSITMAFAARLIAPGMDAAKLVLPLLIAFYPTVLASYYASYRDVFADGS